MAKFRVTSPDGATFEVTAPDDATPDQVQAYAQANMPKASAPAVSAQPAEGSRARAQKQSEGVLGRAVANLIPGAIRGAGSIGATLLTPYDLAAGNTQSIGNPERRQAIDAGLQALGADPTDPGYRLGKVGGEVAGTLGAGPALGVAARALPALARVAPNAIRAVETGGMMAGNRAPGALGLAQNMATRSAGGAVAGGASAGLVDPESAQFGATVGAALPLGVAAAGAAGRGLGRTLAGPAQSPELAASVQQARGAGYVIPPTQARPTLANRIIEGFSGKITTAQNASAANQSVTNGMAAKAIGLPETAPLSPEVLDAVRAEAGKAYDAVAKMGRFDATGVKLPASVKVEHSISPLLAGKTQSVDSAELVRAWKQANADSTAYYRAYGRDANPETLAKAKEAASAAKQIDDFMTKRVAEAQAKKPGQLIADFASGKITQEDFLKQALTAGNEKSLTEALKQARVRIAKTYSVESAMNPLTGSVDARKLAKQLEKGKVLSGDLLTAAEFGARFPKAAQPVEGMGSLPQTSPLDWAAMGSMSAVTGNPLMMLGTFMRPLSRAAALSGPVQNRLVQAPATQQNALARLLSDPRLQQLGYLGAPVAATSAGR